VHLSAKPDLSHITPHYAVGNTKGFLSYRAPSRFACDADSFVFPLGRWVAARSTIQHATYIHTVSSPENLRRSVYFYRHAFAHLLRAILSERQQPQRHPAFLPRTYPTSDRSVVHLRRSSNIPRMPWHPSKCREAGLWRCCACAVANCTRVICATTAEKTEAP
jgi:hypothetical protein